MYGVELRSYPCYTVSSPTHKLLRKITFEHYYFIYRPCITMMAFILQCWVLVRIAVLCTQLVVSCNTHCLGDRSVSRAPEAGVIGVSGRQRRQRVEVARANPLIGQMWKPGTRCKRALVIRVYGTYGFSKLVLNPI